MRSMRAASAVRDPLLTDVSKEPRSSCTRQKRHTRSSFDVDSRSGYVPHGSRSAAGNAAASQLTEEAHAQDMHTRTRTVCTWSVGGGGRRKTIFHQTGGRAARSGHATSHGISSNLQPRSEHAGQVRCVDSTPSCVYHPLSDNVDDEMFHAAP